MPRPFSLATALALAFALHFSAPAARAQSSNAAYIYDSDFGSGLNDPDKGKDSPAGKGAKKGSSIFNNSIIGVPPGPSPYTYTTAAGTKVTFTDLLVKDVSSSATFAGFDTILLYEVCDIQTQPLLLTAINNYIESGLGKVVIYDGDRCADRGAAYAGQAHYDPGFTFPFTSQNPGPSGFCDGKLLTVEAESPPAVLSRGLQTSLPVTVPACDGTPGDCTDTVGDSNVITSNDPAWCILVSGTNHITRSDNKCDLGLGSPLPPATGAQVAYAKPAKGGLVIWVGWDNWNMLIPTPGINTINYDKVLFENILDQPFSIAGKTPTPDGLPCQMLVAAPTATETPSASPSITSSATSTYTPRATPSVTSSGTSTATVTASRTPTETATASKTPTSTRTATATPTITATASRSPTRTRLPAQIPVIASPNSPLGIVLIGSLAVALALRLHRRKR